MNFRKKLWQQIYNIIGNKYVFFKMVYLFESIQLLTYPSVHLII